MRLREVESALRELELLPSTGLTVLLTLNLTRIACEQSAALEHGTILGVCFAESPSDAKAYRTGLPVLSPTLNVDQDVEVFKRTCQRKRLLKHLLYAVAVEIIFDRGPVDNNVALAGPKVNTCNRGLASSGSVVLRNGHLLVPLYTCAGNGSGFWPAWG